MAENPQSYYGTWINRQRSLLPGLDEELDPLTAKLEHLIIILDTLGLEAFVAPPSRGRGRPPDDRPAIARSFVAKAVLTIPTTSALIERLQIDRALRRICGWERRSEVPSEATFSRAFAEFAAQGLPERVHEQLVRHHLQDHIVGHISRDATEIEAQRNPAAGRRMTRRRLRRPSASVGVRARMKVLPTQAADPHRAAAHAIARRDARRVANPM